MGPQVSGGYQHGLLVLAGVKRLGSVLQLAPCSSPQGSGLPELTARASRHRPTLAKLRVPPQANLFFIDRLFSGRGLSATRRLGPAKEGANPPPAHSTRRLFS